MGRGTLELTHVDLFSGIGGFALAARWTGFKTIVFCEKDEFCQKVLKKHWSEVPIISEIRDFDGTKWQGATLLTGGFPCQDISQANQKGIGINGKQSRLWRQMLRITYEIRPKYIIVENVSALLNRGLGRILGELASIGYDAQWHCISASSIGAPHIRDRIWIVAYPKRFSRFNFFLGWQNSKKVDFWKKEEEKWGINWYFTELGASSLLGLDREWSKRNGKPEVLRISNGIPRQLDRLKALGNAIVPQIAEVIMRGIAEIENV